MEFAPEQIDEIGFRTCKQCNDLPGTGTGSTAGKNNPQCKSCWELEHFQPAMLDHSGKCDPKTHNLD